MTSFFLLQGRQNVLCHLAVAEAYFYTGSHWRLQRGAVVVGALRVGPRGASPHPCCLWGHTKAALPQSFGGKCEFGRTGEEFFYTRIFLVFFSRSFYTRTQRRATLGGVEMSSGFSSFLLLYPVRPHGKPAADTKRDGHVTYAHLCVSQVHFESYFFSKI